MTSFSLWSVICAGLVVDISLASQWSAHYSAYSDYPTKEIWTQWYNTDRPSSFGGDDESLYSIRKRGWDVCPGYNILSAQCRIVGSMNIFTSSDVTQQTDVDTLYRPCTKGGLYCRNRDQPDGRMCQDYEVRFKCTSGSVTDEAVYTWVAVLAVVFLVIPIAWVIIINLKRRYCPSAEDRARDQASANERGSSVATLTDPSLAEPPPSYEDLFGGGSPIGSSQFAFGSTSTLLTNEVQRSGTVVNSQQSQPIEGSITQSSGSRDNPGFSENSGGSGSNTNNDNNRQRTRLHPGMHLPAFSIMRQISVGQPTPPPSYDDAIVKLGVPPIKKDSS